MINQEILQGLKFALSRRESLQSAMQSFYNAGYEKREIEEAARALQMEIFQQIQPTQPPLSQSAPQQKKQQPQLPVKNQPAIKQLETPVEPVVQQAPEQRQKVSNYEREKRDTVTIALVIILIILLGSLIGVFIFKQRIVEFLNTLF